MDIRVRYSSVDRFSQTRRFKTLAGAQRYAQKWVGETPDISETFGYAVSADGIGKVTVTGCPLTDLFPKTSAAQEKALADYYNDEYMEQTRELREGWAEAEDALYHFRRF